MRYAPSAGARRMPALMPARRAAADTHITLCRQPRMRMPRAIRAAQPLPYARDDAPSAAIDVRYAPHAADSAVILRRQITRAYARAVYADAPRRRAARAMARRLRRLSVLRHVERRRLMPRRRFFALPLIRTPFIMLMPRLIRYAGHLLPLIHAPPRYFILLRRLRHGTRQPPPLICRQPLLRCYAQARDASHSRFRHMAPPRYALTPPLPPPFIA